MISLAENSGLDFDIEVSGGASGTTAWVIQTAENGVKTMLVSIPLRYMHTNVETLKIDDICAVSKLISLWLSNSV